MEAWVECGGAFIKADVVRWREAVFEDRRKGRKPAFLGEREVVAEILGEIDPTGFLSLLVRDCRITSTSQKARLPLPPVLPKGAEIRRRKKTLLKNGLHRLAWEDEGARDMVASRFLSDPTPDDR
jgi:hypothetical protein